MIWLTVWLLVVKPTGLVTDLAEIISPAAETRLEADLEAYTASTGNELAVVTLKSLEGDTIENTAVALFEDWGIGKKNQDNGVLLLVAPQEREMRIEVGYGLEPVLTDARAGEIIRETITPRFKENDYDGGISGGVGAIMAVLSSQELSRPNLTDNNDGGLTAVIIIFIIVVIIILLARRARNGPWRFQKSSWGGLPAGRQGFSSGKSSRGSFGGFGGGRSGGGGASGRW